MRFYLFLLFILCSFFCSAQQSCERRITISKNRYDYQYYRAVYLCYSNHKWGATDEYGNYCVEAIYDTLIPLTQRTSFIAALNKKYGVVSEDGIVLISFDCDTILQDGYSYAAKRNGKWGLLDRKGNKITEFIYDRIEEAGYQHYHLLFKKKEVYDSNIQKRIRRQFKINDTLEAWGPDRKAIIVLERNKNGELVPSKQGWIYPIGTIYKLWDGNESDSYYCDRVGKKLITPLWLSEVLSGNENGSYLILTQNHHIGFVDQHFKIISDTIWYQVSDPFNMMKGKEIISVFWLKRENSFNSDDSCFGGWMMSDENGRLLSDLKFRTPINFGEYFSPGHSKTLYGSENGKIGMIDDQLRVVILPVFDSVWILSSEINPGYIVKTNTKFGVLDSSGKFMLDTIYDHISMLAGIHNAYYLARGKQQIVFLSDSMKFISLGEFYQQTAQETIYDYTNSLVDFQLSYSYRGPDPYTNSIKSLYWYIKLINEKNVQSLENPFVFENTGSELNYIIEGSYSCWNYEYSYTFKFPLFQLYAFDSAYISFFRADTLFPNDYRFDRSNFFYKMNSSKSKYTFSNYSISGDTIHSITLDSLFLSSDTLREVLHRRACKKLQAKAGLNSDYRKNGYHLTENFLLTGTSGIILFEESVADEKGYRTNWAVLLTWAEINDLIDSTGPLRRKH